MKLNFTKFHSIRFKLIASLIVVSLFIGLISILVGGNLLYKSVLAEANNRIRQDLNVARVIYDQRTYSISLALEVAASSDEFKQAVVHYEDKALLNQLIDEIVDMVKLDFAGVTNIDGRVISRYGYKDENFVRNPIISSNPFVLSVIKNRSSIAGTAVIGCGNLLVENPTLVKKADIRDFSDSKSDKDLSGQIAALTIGAAVPIVVNGRPAGIVYGGFLLNKDSAIVDKIGETVFKNEIYKERNVGTATIFYNNLRIATSVKDSSGNRALGTPASDEVTLRVLRQGERWTDRAKVLDDWYITAYEPIADINKNRVGMLYVGVLEAKYLDVRAKAILVFSGITLAGVFVAICLGWLFTGRIMSPVSHLIRASAQISGGNFFPDIGPISKDDIGQLQENFLIMSQALQEREKRQKAESEIRLIQSEKQASVGKLAAGVAHEINNPLTAVLTFTHLILRRNDLDDEIRSDLETVASQTERVRNIVKSLLDFSRQTALSTEPTDVNKLIEQSVKLMENQALIKGVLLKFKRDDDLPVFMIDPNQCTSVFVNMIINALDATSAGGTIDIQAKKSVMNDKIGVEILFYDTGSGILQEHISKIFDPFFTTKEVGAGTGLGLSVSAGIVQRHGGTIKVHSKPDVGTTFTIWLPYKSSDEAAKSDTRKEV